jgi:hypothetical protein
LDAILGKTNVQSPYTIAQQVEVKRDFFTINGFQSTTGAIEGTHVAIKAPSQNEFNPVKQTRLPLLMCR